jgi:hypothetical protein
MPILHGFGQAALAIIVRMTRSWGQLGLFSGALAGLLGCGEAAEGSPDAETPSGLSAVEVTTVTTVQASSGIFLSPRPQQTRPAYVERGRDGEAQVSVPSAELDRAKVDSALLFRSDTDLPETVQLQATFSSLAGQAEPLPQHYFPALSSDGARANWPLELKAPASGAATDAWTEWDGWQAFPGLFVGAADAAEAAPAATLDYEMLGLQSPLVLSSEGEDILVTNRSQQTIASALLVYSHAGGIGVRVVGDLGPGMQRVTTTGPKEAPAAELLDKARLQLEAFFAGSMGANVGMAVARAKSIPFLETQGLRLIYLLDPQQAPASIALPAGLAEQRRFVLCQAEVLTSAEEANVVGLLDSSELAASDVTSTLGRFTRAKLEVARLLGSEHAQAEASALLESLSE